MLVQAVALQMFYGSHLDIVSRRLSSAVAGEIASTLELIRRYPGPRNEDWILRMARDQYDIAMQIEPGAKLVPERRINVLGPMDDDLAERDAAEGAPPVHHGLDDRSAIGADPRAAR